MLKALAVRAGISPTWTDQAGEEQQVSPDTLRALLGAFGLPADSDGTMRNSMSALEGSVGSGARFTTARVGQPIAVSNEVKAGDKVEVEFEGGDRRPLIVQDAGNGAVALPPLEEPGYHAVWMPEGALTVATAPARCVTIADLTDGRGGWGLAAQVYSLRRAGDGGVGDFGGVAALGRAAARLGADALAISPVHALFGAEPGHFSPYSPSTRLLYNPLHASPELGAPADVLRDIVGRSGLASEMAPLEQRDTIDWVASSPLRLKLLRLLFEAIRTAKSNQAWRADFENYLATASPHLKAHATFEALHAYHLQRDKSQWDWRSWSSGYRDPNGQAVAAFAREHSDEVEFQVFLQWMTGRSYAEAQRICREAGMAVGLIADLAIGMDRSGSHAWSRQHEVLDGLSIGAPPDYYSTTGQNWGLTTFSPRGLATSGYAPFIDTLRACLRHVGGLRIDHVMGMSRLWLIPEGASAVEGAYVGFPSETMFRLIALESWRHRAIVLGEDLGTLPDGFREYLRDQGVSGLRVLRFERTDHDYTPPAEWDANAAALTTTHDLVPTAGWWAASDLDAEDRGGRETREWDRGVLWRSFGREGVTQDEQPGATETAPVVDAAIRYIAKAPSRLKLLAIEDALGVETQPNVPGTTFEKPNWRHRLASDAGELLDDSSVQQRLRILGPPRVQS